MGTWLNIFLQRSTGYCKVSVNQFFSVLNKIEVPCVKVRGHESNFLDSLSQPFEIGPNDRRMNSNAFLEQLSCSWPHIILDKISKKVGLWF